jgi:hypothetical protein
VYVGRKEEMTKEKGKEKGLRTVFFTVDRHSLGPSRSAIRHLRALQITTKSNCRRGVPMDTPMPKSNSF